MEERYKQQVQTFLCGEYGRFASTLAQRLGTALQGEVVREDYLVLLKNILAPHEEKIILQLIHMIVKDPVLIHKDNYVVMLTALRFASSDTHRANLIILRNCRDLFPIIEDTFLLDPDGYTCPELVSMMGSIATDEGADICLPYLYPLLDILPRIAQHEGVITVVATLLWINLSRSEPATGASVVDREGQSPADERPTRKESPSVTAASAADATARAAVATAAAASAAEDATLRSSEKAGRVPTPSTRPLQAMGERELERIVMMACGALNAAFTGSHFKERQWGPLPSCLALSQLCTTSKRSRQILWRLNRVPLIANVLLRPTAEAWPVASFPSGYFDHAIACAMRCLCMLAQEENLLSVAPFLLKAVGHILDINTDPSVERAGLELLYVASSQQLGSSLRHALPNAGNAEGSIVLLGEVAEGRSSSASAGREDKVGTLAGAAPGGPLQIALEQSGWSVATASVKRERGFWSRLRHGHRRPPPLSGGNGDPGLHSLNDGEDDSDSAAAIQGPDAASPALARAASAHTSVATLPAEPRETQAREATGFRATVSRLKQAATTLVSATERLRGRSSRTHIAKQLDAELARKIEESDGVALLVPLSDADDSQLLRDNSAVLVAMRFACFLRRPVALILDRSGAPSAPAELAAAELRGAGVQSLLEGLQRLSLSTVKLIELPDAATGATTAAGALIEHVRECQ